MQQYTLVAAFFAAVVVLLTPSTSASIISCPPSNPQEASPNLRQLCSAIEQVISENVAPFQDQFSRLDDRNVNGNAKRQDVDHVFLRFGRRFGL